MNAAPATESETGMLVLPIVCEGTTSQQDEIQTNSSEELDFMY